MSQAILDSKDKFVDGAPVKHSKKRISHGTSQSAASELKRGHTVSAHSFLPVLRKPGAYNANNAQAPLRNQAPAGRAASVPFY